MKTIALVLLFGVLWFNSFAQENSASALNLTLTNYLIDTGTGSGCTQLTGTLGASGSGVPTCAGIDNNDVWYAFTAQTQAAKFVASSVSTDLVIQVLQAGTLTSVACSNTTGVGGTETLRVSQLVAGQNYFSRIHSSNGAGGAFTVCGQFYPASEVRNGWYPVFTPDVGLPGYRINQTVNRVFYTPYNDQITGTRWLFVNSATNEEHVATVNGTSGVVNISTVPGICFGNSYDVYVEVRVDGFWCGYSVGRQIIMEAVPTTEMEPAYAGQYYNLNDNLKARFVGNQQNIEWRFTTNNGDVVFSNLALANSSFVYFENLPCIRYNRIYQIETRVEYCGVLGPWSAPQVVFTNPVPKVNLRPQFCNTTQWPGVTLLAEYLPVVDAYGWQLAPIAANDPSMTPIGPAIVVTTPSVFLQVLPLGVTSGQTYRVGVKPFLGTTDNCGDPQEGDYGFFCPVTFGNPNAFIPEPQFMDDATPITDDFAPIATGKLVVYPVPANSSPLYLNTAQSNLRGQVMLTVYNSMGRQVHNENIANIEDQPLLNLHLSDAWSAGRYIVVLQSSDEVMSTNFLIIR